MQGQLDLDLDLKYVLRVYTEFSAQTALKQKLVNPQWTQPIPISSVLLGGSRRKKRNIADKRLEKGGGGLVGDFRQWGWVGFLKSEIDWKADEV